VRDKRKINWIFDAHRPETVFHAAAHKHVPLMETSPEEAIKNNVFGTLNVSEAAHRFEAEKFILISTDKAVNPTNIMGASKRLCEMIVQTMDSTSQKTDYVAVRFGNVLGSNGSVIPLFKEQIKNGGPVTLTHKDIVRYFMTIPEAVQLVLQAGSYALGGEIFVLDMGDPVRIYDLAENLIRLSGYEPHNEIQIRITGLRPGEKLYEELLMAEEGLESTPNELIFVGRPNGFDKEGLKKTLEQLEKDVHDERISGDELKEIIHGIVPTYQPDLKKKGQSAI
jgi:FlaA1/EpsC-like NDP-sugar epimerase